MLVSMKDNDVCGLATVMKHMNIYCSYYQQPLSQSLSQALIVS